MVALVGASFGASGRVDFVGTVSRVSMETYPSATSCGGKTWAAKTGNMALFTSSANSNN